MPLNETIRENDRFLIFYWDNLPKGAPHPLLIPAHIVKGGMLQGFIISARDHRFLRDVILSILKKIDSYNPYRDGIGWTGVHLVTGPVIYTETIFNTINKQTDQVFREGLPFKEFGYKPYFAGKYSGGEYQKKISMSDYRKSVRPLIKNDNQLLQTTNIVWLHVLRIYRKLKGLSR